MPTPKLAQPPLLPKLRFTISCVLDLLPDEIGAVEETLEKCREYGEASIVSVELMSRNPAPSPRKRS